MVGLLVEAPRLVSLPAEQLDHLVAVDRLLQHLGDVAHRLLHIAGSSCRSRTLISRTTPTMSGVITSASSVSFQLSHSIHASRPTMDSASLKITVSTLVAAAVTCVTS